MTARCLALVLFLCIPALAQEFPSGRDFLTDYEVDVLREKQEFDDRIEAYIKFAALRLELIEQLLAEEEPGRGAKVHRSLDEYGSIIEAVDDVIDDALIRNRKMEGALGGLLAAEARFASRLSAIAAQPAADAWRYEFMLEDAISITQDSMELLAEDLGDRKRTVLQAEEAHKKRQKESMAPERRREVEQVRAQEEAATAERQRKRPTLLRPGEKVGGN